MSCAMLLIGLNFMAKFQVSGAQFTQTVVRCFFFATVVNLSGSLPTSILFCVSYDKFRCRVYPVLIGTQRMQHTHHSHHHVIIATCERTNQIGIDGQTQPN
jgi:hypothetical protein